MSTINSFVRQHPVLGYYALVFVISWGGLLWLIGGPGHIPGTPDETARLFPAMFIITIAGPALAGILLTALVAGRAGLGDLRSRLLRWRVGARWYAVAILITPLSVLATLLVLSLGSPLYVPGFVGKSIGANMIQFGLLACAGLATALMEELGWTGFVIPRLRLRYGVFATGLLMGLLWGAWHFLSNVWGPEPTGELSLAVVMPVLLFTFLPPYRMLMLWVYDHTDSVLLAILMHASLIAFWQFFMPAGLAGMPFVIWYLAWAFALWAVVAVVAIAGARQPVRPRLLSERQ